MKRTGWMDRSDVAFGWPTRSRASGARPHASSHPSTGIIATRGRKTRKVRGYRRAGVAALDYILVLGVILPLVAFIVGAAPKIMRLAYEMSCVMISWPFM